MRIIKWFLGFLLVLVTLTILIVGYIAMTFDANSYKDSIIQTIKEETGRDLSLDGELEMSFFPWIGVTVNNASLSNADGFTAEEFLKINQASVRLQLIPLLSKTVIADRIQFSGVEVWLERDAKGKTNWDDITERVAANTDESADTSELESEISGSIAGLSLEDTVLHWKDQLGGQDLSLTIKRFDTGELKPDTPTSVDGEIHFELKDPEIQGQALFSGVTRVSQLDPFILIEPQLSVDLQGVGTQAENIHAKIGTTEIRYENGEIILSDPDIDYEVLNMPSLGEHAEGNIKGNKLSVNDGDINLEQASLTLDLTGSAFLVDDLEASMRADSMSINMDKDTMSIPEFTLQSLGLNIAGSLNGTNITKDSLALTGKIAIADFSPKAIAPKLDIELPEMSDEAWAQANLKGNYRATPNSVALSNMSTVIDGTEWRGKASIDDLNNNKVSFDLAAASLDANRLMPPEQADALQDKEADAASAAAVNAIEIPTEPLKQWDAKGTLRLGTLTFGNIVTTDLEAGINLLDGKLRVFPSKANFFGGQYSGDIRLDVTGATPRMQADEKITNIDLDAMGKALWAESYMTGRTNGRIVFDASGKTVGAMRESAKGNVEFKVTDGVLLGFDLNYAVANAVSLFRSKSMSDTTDTKKTAFQSLSATASVDNGVLQNDDFLAVMPRMRIRGKGQLNLITTGINYQVTADVLESKSANTPVDPETAVSLDELVGASIPIKVTGTMAEPTIRPDVAGYLKNKAEQEIRDRAQQEIEDKLKDKLGGGILGDLLGGESVEPEPEEPAPEEVVPEEPVPEEPIVDPVDQKKEELEQKAKDKLKDIFGG